MSRDTQGWSQFMSARKAHYFLQGTVVSLCRQWIVIARRDDSEHDSPDNCAVCKRKRAKLTVREAPLP